MEYKSILSLSDYLETIENLTREYNISGNPTFQPFLYRGLCKFDYELLPAVFRVVVDTEERGEQKLKISNKKYTEFITEIDLLKAFKCDASSIIEQPRTEQHHWLEYAQHYGVPTRLLDWTSNPMAALYFACRDEIKDDGAVWVLHRINYDKYSRKLNDIDLTYDNDTIYDSIVKMIEGVITYNLPILYKPYYIDKRMNAQCSFFLAWGNDTRALEEMIYNEESKMVVREQVGNTRVKSIQQEAALLCKLHIHADRKQPILHQLNIIGINEKTLFPGLDGIGRYIERQYRFDYNESKEFH